MSFARDTLILLCGRVLAAALAVVTPLVLAIWLDPRDFGLVSLVFTLAWGAAVLGDPGLAPAHTYLLARDARDRAAALLFSLCYAALFAAACAAAAFVPPLRDLIASIPGQPPKPLLPYALAAAPLLLLLNLHGGCLLGLRRTWEYGAMDLLRHGLVLTALAAVIASGRPHAAAACLAWLTGLALAALASTLYLLTPADFSAVCPSRYARAALGYGGQMYVAAVGFFLMRRADYLFLQRFHGAEAVAVYNLATQMAEVMLLLPAAVGLALFPRAVAMEPQAADRQAAKAARLTMLYAWLALPLLATAFWLLLMGLEQAGRPRYWMSWPAFLALLPGCAALAVATVISQHFQGRRMQRLSSYAVACMAVLNLGFNVVLIPRYGAIGAAAATTICYLGGAAVTIGLFCRLGTVSLRDVLLARRDDLTLWPRPSAPDGPG